MVRVVALSDSHSLHRRFEIPAGDLLIHAGDMTSRGGLQELAEFNRFLGELPHPHKVVIAGNHDFCFERSNYQARNVLTNAIYLQDETVEIEGLTIYGSPWQPEFFDWAFNLPRGEPLRRKWAQIPEDVDLLVTHGPPHGILDFTVHKQQVGCEELLKRVLEVRPKAHVFGHIHEAYGQEESQGILFVNASICDVRYRPVNPPIVFDA